VAGLAAAERERISSLIRNVAANIPVLIVEHDIDRVLGFPQRVTVMNQGVMLMTGTRDAVRNDRRVQEIYTGAGIPGLSDEVQRDAGQVLRFSFMTRRSMCAKARSWRCWAATAPASPRC
jgi:branched-chain amino acid transport system ATP-binding protein